MGSSGVEIAKESTVVIYDKNNGRVVHTHHFVTAKGGVHPDRNTQEKQATEHAELAHASLSKSFGILHADSANMKPGVQYKVDTKKLVLTEVQ